MRLIAFLILALTSCVPPEYSLKQPTLEFPPLSTERVNPDFSLRHSCHAIAIGPYDYVTAAHCLPHAHDYTVTHSDAKRDIAFLTLPVPVAHWVDVAEDVPAVGYTRRGAVVITGPDTFLGEVWHGDSGSGIYTSDGQLIGIVTKCTARNNVCVQGMTAYYARVYPTEVQR